MSFLSAEESDVYRRYHRPGSGESQRCIVNHVALSAANTKEHEMKKCELAYDLIKMGHHVITECVSADGKRRDVVDLSEDGIYEVVHKNITPDIIRKYLRDKVCVVFASPEAMAEWQAVAIKLNKEE